MEYKLVLVSYMSLTKTRIKKVFQGAIDNIKAGKEPNVKGEMIKQGYSENSAKVLKVTITKAWQELLNSIDDEEVVNRITDILRDEDKRSSLTAADMLLKLKDRYPAQKSKVIGLFDIVEQLDREDSRET